MYDRVEMDGGEKYLLESGKGTVTSQCQGDQHYE
jgi:hypothetical protein